MGNGRSDVDVYIAGTGIVSIRQLTREAMNAIKESTVAYTLHSQGPYYEVLEEFLDGMVDETVNLFTEYQEGKERIEVYEAATRRIVSEAASREDTVVFLTYGHPLVFVKPTRQIVERADERDLEVEIVPGISSFDCLYADLLLDPAKDGLQIFDATDLLLREFDLDPHVPTFLLQIGSVETVYYSTKQNEPHRFTRIKEYLGQFYPDDHTMFLTQSAPFESSESKQIPIELREFEEMHDRINNIHTLYIPPIEEKSVVNEELEELVHSKAHLEEITKDEFREVEL